MYFNNDDHEKRFKTLLELDDTDGVDVERQALFYIIASNPELYSLKDELYDFGVSLANVYSLDKGPLAENISDKDKALMRLGYNLFNGQKGNQVDPLRIFSPLSLNDSEVAIQALKIRFNIV